LNRVLELDGRSFIASNYLALAYEAKGGRAKAIEWAENSGRIAPLPVAFGVRGWLYGLDGRLDEAQRMLDELKEQTKGAYVSPMHFALLYCGTGDVEAWRKAMWAAYEERCLCAEAGQRTACPAPHPRVSSCQHLYAPMVFGIIPECRSAS